MATATVSAGRRGQYFYEAKVRGKIELRSVGNAQVVKLEGVDEQGRQLATVAFPRCGVDGKAEQQTKVVVGLRGDHGFIATEISKPPPPSAATRAADEHGGSTPIHLDLGSLGPVFDRIKDLEARCASYEERIAALEG